MGYSQAEKKDHVMLKDVIDRIFEDYGDDYFVERGSLNTVWELCDENPIWDQARRNGDLTIRKGFKII